MCEVWGLVPSFKAKSGLNSVTNFYCQFCPLGCHSDRCSENHNTPLRAFSMLLGLSISPFYLFYTKQEPRMLLDPWGGCSEHLGTICYHRYRLKSMLTQANVVLAAQLAPFIVFTLPIAAHTLRSRCLALWLGFKSL